jgi:hypothetical protein
MSRCLDLCHDPLARHCRGLTKPISSGGSRPKLARLQEPFLNCPRPWTRRRVVPRDAAPPRRQLELPDNESDGEDFVVPVGPGGHGLGVLDVDPLEWWDQGAASSAPRSFFCVSDRVLLVGMCYGEDSARAVQAVAMSGPGVSHSA